MHVRLDDRAFGGRELHAIGTPLRVEAVEPVRLHVRLALEELAGRAIEHVHHAVAVGPEHHLARLALPLDVGEHRHLRGVVVELVVRRELVVPLQLAGVDVERDDAVAIEVVAPARAAVPVGRRIAGAEEHEIRLRIVGARVPHADAAGLPRVAGPRLVARLALAREWCRSARAPCRSSRRTPRCSRGSGRRRRRCR